MSITPKSFWKRVDDALYLSNMTLKRVCSSLGLSYVTIINQKNQYNRIPKTEAVYLIANALGTTVEYLLTGKEPTPRYSRIQDIIDWLMAKSDAELDVFRQYNHVPREKEQSSSSRQEA